MRILPMLFNTDMVCALLADRKSATRQVVKLHSKQCVFSGMKYTGDVYAVFSKRQSSGYEIVRAPYWVGDILYVRESFHQTPNGQYWYKADNICKGCAEDGFCLPRGVEYHETCKICEYYAGYSNIKWHPSVHMPREAARIFLRVTKVRVERLHEITDDEVKAEGVQSKKKEWERIDFADLWNSTIKPKDLALYGWDADPYVWVIEFEKISKEEALKHDQRGRDSSHE